MKGQVAVMRVWLMAALGALLVFLFVITLFRAPKPPIKRPTEVPANAAKVELASSADDLLKEEAGLRDPTPLFLPTRWNAGEDALAMNEPREPGGSFQNYPPKLNFPEAELRLEVPAVVAIPSKPAEAFAIDKTERPFAGFGQVESPIVPLPLRGGFVEVADANSGELRLQQPLKEDRPPGPEGNWEPLEFLLAVDSAGVVRPPVLTESSRAPAVDVFFQNYLLNVLHLGERLGPGFYRVSIGP